MPSHVQAEEAEASWSTRLVTKIVDNLQIHVSNVHIRYEDRVLHADDPFSFGLMIGRFAAESTDSTWKPSYVENQKILFKLCSLQGLTVIRITLVHWHTGGAGSVSGA